MTEIRFHPRVKKDLKQIDTKLLSKIRDDYLTQIQENPNTGKPLKGALHDIFSYHFKFKNVHYRIAYMYSPKDHIVTILMIGKRENFYTVLSRRIS